MSLKNYKLFVSKPVALPLGYAPLARRGTIIGNVGVGNNFDADTDDLWSYDGMK
jgi:hypothetical protein